MATMKKAQSGIKTAKSSKRDIQMYKGPKGEILSGEGKTPPFGGPKPKKGTKILDIDTGKYEIVKKNGGRVKKAQSGATLKKRTGKASKATMKSGGSMKKCKYGCK